MLALLLAFVPAAVAQTTYEQLTSIADIDESALYVLGVEDIGFHYSGTSSWGNVALPSEETPIYYTLSKAHDGTSFTAQATIGEETLYLKIVNSNNFKMSTIATDTTNLVIGVEGGDEYAVAGKLFTDRRLCINGTLGLRAYNHPQGNTAYFYKVVTMSTATYAVCFNAAGGTFVGNSDFPNTTNHKEAGTYTLPMATRQGCKFNGWTTLENSTPLTGNYAVANAVDFTASFTVNEIVVTPPSIAANDVEIACDATSGTLAYTIQNEPEPAGSVTSATVTSGDWISVAGSSPYTSPIAFSCTANSLSTSRTATLRLTYTYGNSQTITKDVTVTQSANANYTVVNSETQLNSAIAQTTTTFVKLGADITLSAHLSIGNSSTRNVTLDLNGHTLQRNLAATDANGHVIEIYSQGTLTIIDGAGGGMLKGGNANNGGGICNYGTLYFKGGTITACQASKQGGAIKNNAGCTVNMSGGTILGCWGADCGGIFNDAGGILIISGGTISGNTSNAGGGGVVNYGTLTITGGIIHNNTATTRGGGIWNNSTLSITGATIIGNRAKINGGGIHCAGGTATISGTSITGNTSPNGGGIYGLEGSTLAISGCTVTANTARKDGGGIANRGTVTVTGSTISDNKAAENGAGVWNCGTLNMGDPSGTVSVRGNTCGNSGGGVWNSASLNMEGTVIVTGNSKQDGWTSNLYCTNGHVITVTGDLGNSRISVSHEGNDGYLTSGYNDHNATTNHFDNDYPEACNLDLINNEAKLTRRSDVVCYVERSWDGSKVVQTMKTVPAGSTTTLSGCTDDDESYPSGTWLVVNGNNVARGQITATSGTVNLILCDGAKLTSEMGIKSGATLNIYGQRDNSGSLDGFICVRSDRTLNIHGGNISANGRSGQSGIGGDYQNTCGTIAIYGGTVSAEGGAGGAGIGSGYDKTNNISSGNIKIYGGSVTAQGGYHNTGQSGAGIGGGGQSSGETVYIYGGDVVAFAADDAAGIGSGEEATVGTRNIDGGTITIYGGEVHARGKDEGAGIGAGQNAALGIVNLLGGSIEVWGDDNSNAIAGHDATDGNKSLTIGDHMKVEGGDYLTNLSPYGAGNRYWGITNKYVRLAPCEHNGATYTGNAGEFAPHASCTYCTAPLFNVSGGGWHAIASPTSEYGKTTVAATDITGRYDLLCYNEATATWENQKAGDGAAGFTTLERGRGYIYRRADNAVVGFSGNKNSGNIAVSHSASCADASLRGFNLVGNPYNHTYTYGSPYYELLPDGTWLAHPSGTIAIGQAFLVNSSAGSYTFTEGNKSCATSTLTFTITDGELSDVAYVRLDGGESMKKIAHLDGNAPLIYIPHDDADYAVDVMDKGEFQLHVKTTVPKQYTLDATGPLQGMQIIDLHTGDEITLPYKLESAGHFLVRMLPKNNNASFAVINGNNVIVSGTGTLQTFDILGRPIFSREVSGLRSHVSTYNFPGAGVYILRLGEKSQKIVIR